MAVSEERIEFGIPAGVYGAFTAIPSTPPPWPALIVIHPVTGLDAMMTQRTRDFAADGYLAVAPDIYTHEAGYEQHTPTTIEAAAHIWQGRDEAAREVLLQAFDPQTRAQIVAARTWMEARKTTTYVDVIAGCFGYVRARSDVRGIGCIGYCMGGRLTAELAVSGADLAAAVIYYGPSPKAETIPNIRCPVEGHYAVTDRGITAGVYEFAMAMHAAKKPFNYSVYAADHGFGEPQAQVYNPAAAELANSRSNAFLAKHLSPNKG